MAWPVSSLWRCAAIERNEQIKMATLVSSFWKTTESRRGTDCLWRIGSFLSPPSAKCSYRFFQLSISSIKYQVSTCHDIKYQFCQDINSLLFSYQVSSIKYQVSSINMSWYQISILSGYQFLTFSTKKYLNQKCCVTQKYNGLHVSPAFRKSHQFWWQNE